MLRIALMLALLVAPFTTATAEPSDVTLLPVKLTFGLYTNDSPTTLIKQFSPVLARVEKFMERDLKRQVIFDLQITKTYDDAIYFLSRGVFDFARFGPVSYTTAKDADPNIRILAIEQIDGENVFYGIIATKEGSGITTAEDIRGKRFAFGNEGSTIGRYLAQQYLVENGILAEDLSSYDYLGRHDSVGIAVADGEFDVGALKENTFNKLKKSGYELVEVDRVPNVTKPWLASSQLDATIADSLSRALISIDDQRILSRLKITGFAPAQDSDFEVIRRSIEDNEIFFQRRDF